MTEGIVAIAGRIAQLRSEFGMAQPAGTAATDADFAARLKEAQKAQQTGSAGAGKDVGSAAGPLPTNHKKSKIYGEAKLTTRTREMISEIDSRFGPFSAIGGWRSAQDGGEHPLGRAADFMLSSGGKLPTAANHEKGDQLAAWAKKNAKRLGIKYIIWDQKIWNPLRASEGWRPMENRGSATQNHKDHVHISMN